MTRYEKYKLNWAATIVDVVVILGALYLRHVGEHNWWMLLIILFLTGSYKMVKNDR